MRQLQNIIQRILILNNNDQIDNNDVTAALGEDINVKPREGVLPDYFDADMRRAKEQFEKAYLSHHLGQVDGNVSALAKKIGMERTHLYRKLKSLDISSRDAK